MIEYLQTYDQYVPFIANPLTISLPVRNCTIGEEYTADNKCQPCQAGYYNYAPMFKPDYC